MAKSSNPVTATEIKYPSPSTPMNKSSVELGSSKSGADSNGVAGSGKTGMSPVSSESTSPIKGDGFGDNTFVARGEGRRSTVTYGKG